MPKWNFHKILINKDGKVEDTFASFTKPTSKKIIKAIEKYYRFKVNPSCAGITFLGNFF